MELLPLQPRERLRLVRTRYGSAAKLAREIGKSRSTVCRALQDENKNDLTRALIAKACKISVRKMFGEAA